MYKCSDTKESVATYNEYLKSKHWLKKKIKYFQSYKKRTKNKKKQCECCGKKSTVQLHHKTYDRIGKEKLTDLMYACKKCHEEIHEVVKFRVNKGWNKRDALFTAHKIIKKSYK